FQMRVKTMLVVPFGRRERTTTAQMKLFSNERKRATQCARVWERPEVTSAIVLLDPRECEARNGIVVIDLQHQEPFVVAKADVVARMKFLDQLALQQQCLRFAANNVEIEIVNSIHECAKF